jgi:hypothetical protein
MLRAFRMCVLTDLLECSPALTCYHAAVLIAIRLVIRLHTVCLRAYRSREVEMIFRFTFAWKGLHCLCVFLFKFHHLIVC